MSDNDIKYMIEALASDLAEMLAANFGMSIPEALDALYNSETYSKLINPASGLYFQSARYVYSFLNNEIEKGCMA